VETTVLAEALTCCDDLPPLVAYPLSAPSLAGCTRFPRTIPGDEPSTKAKIPTHFQSAPIPPIKGRSDSADGAALFRPSRGLLAADRAGARRDNRRRSDGVGVGYDFFGSGEGWRRWACDPDSLILAILIVP
jgi:hypothetical protein